MRCPSCDAEFLLGQDLCDGCGADLTFLGVPGPKHGRIHKVLIRDPISQLNAPRPVLLKETDSVATAIEQMCEQRYGSVLVVGESGELVGIFTERDVITRVDLGTPDLEGMNVADVMTRNPDSLKESDTIAMALNRMSAGEYRHVPIVREGKPVGFCSIRGILRYIAENALEIS